MQTTQLLGPGELVPQLEVMPARALVDVTDQVIEGLDQATWEGMAWGPRDMNTNGQRIMGLVLRMSDLDLRYSISNTGTEISELAQEDTLSSLRERIVHAYPDINRPHKPTHDRKWGWSPYADDGEVNQGVLRCAANTIRHSGIQVVEVGLNRKISRTLGGDPDVRAPWFS